MGQARTGGIFVETGRACGSMVGIVTKFTNRFSRLQPPLRTPTDGRAETPDRQRSPRPDPAHGHRTIFASGGRGRAGYIPKEAVAEVAAITHSTVNDVWAVASFYPNFRFQPPCRHQVELCWGSTCHLVGAMDLIGRVFEASGLQDEGDTPDGKLTVRLNTCLGACAQAPVISIDHRLLGRISPQEAAGKGRRFAGRRGPALRTNPRGRKTFSRGRSWAAGRGHCPSECGPAADSPPRMLKW